MRLGGGRLRHVVDVQSMTFTTDSYGGKIRSWSNYLTGVRAEIKPLSGREFGAAQAAQSELTARIRMRYVSGIVPAMRIVHGSINYEIVSVVNVDGMSRELEIMVKTMVNGA